ncbi:MAG: serine protease [Acidimicrobiia bacterium]|nr:MAG: serine protease [Acidimicrobiia bacterium]
MAAWNDLLSEFNGQPDDAARTAWFKAEFASSLQRISTIRDDSNVLIYSSAFLHKPQAPAHKLQISPEDLNGFMSVVYGMSWSKPLTLLLHTPGGITNAAETIVRYLRAKFPHIEVVVPAYAMSAGTMISLASDRIIMGHQSQLGPIDPQMPVGGGRFVSARAVVDQFAKAKEEITDDLTLAHIWAPILQSLGPSLLQEAQNALDYGERMVAEWLAEWMLKGDPHRVSKAASIAEHFNDATQHKSHGRRIDRAEAASKGVVVEALEDDQDLQDAVLTVYHLATILMEHSPAAKLMWTHHDRQWIMNWGAAP